MDYKKFKLEPTSLNDTWQNLKTRIQNGFEIQKQVLEELKSDDILNYNDAIILAPDYQREYRSSISDESSLIESALLGIPIPPIFLASHKLKGVQVLNVVDGQHRLRAFYRYLNSEFALQGLTILKDLNDQKFNDLDIHTKTYLISCGVNIITFRNFPGKDYELEIFSRYNKGTKPLTSQEIRHAVYDSRINQFVNSFCHKMIQDKEGKLSQAYAISQDRYLKKVIHENIFVILSILEYGIDQSSQNLKGGFSRLQNSPAYAESYMQKKSQNADDEVLVETEYQNVKTTFDDFNHFILLLTEITPFPFSREIYGISSRRGNKFQVSISMILSGLYKKLRDSNFDLEKLTCRRELSNFKTELTQIIEASHLEDADYKASTTNPYEIEKIVENFDIEKISKNFDVNC